MWRWQKSTEKCQLIDMLQFKKVIFVYKYNIVVKDGNVIITGGSISGWTPGNEEEDIVINGEEINPQTNNML